MNSLQSQLAVLDVCSSECLWQDLGTAHLADGIFAVNMWIRKMLWRKWLFVRKFMLILTGLGAFSIASGVTSSFSRHSHRLCFWTRAVKNMIAAAMQMHAASVCSSSVPFLVNNEAANTRVILRSEYLALVVIWYLAYCLYQHPHSMQIEAEKCVGFFIV